MLQQSQIEQYWNNGFLVIRDVVDSPSIESLLTALKKHPPFDGIVPGEYPAPGRYTLATQCLADPDLAVIAEHPEILECARTLLEDEPILTAFVMYDRTPGGPPIPMHHDYKRWRPVGSSMNWLFAIVPLDDFDARNGQLFIAPGSHRLERVRDSGKKTLEVDPAVVPDQEIFVDPQLKRGDLCLMNMHCWHKAAGNSGDSHRRGFFNKYAGKRFPPATGYYQYREAVFNALSEDSKSLIAVHSDLSMDRVGLLLQKDDKFLTLGGKLPTGPTFHEHAIPDWDLGNFVAAAHQTARSLLRIETPWLSYIDDVAESESLTRVYGYPLNPNGFPVPYLGDWLTLEQLNDQKETDPAIPNLVRKWLDPEIVRGKAVSQAQARIDQFAY